MLRTERMLYFGSFRVGERGRRVSDIDLGAGDVERPAIQLSTLCQSQHGVFRHRVRGAIYPPMNPNEVSGLSIKTFNWATSYWVEEHGLILNRCLFIKDLVSLISPHLNVI